MNLRLVVRYGEHGVGRGGDAVATGVEPDGLGLVISVRIRRLCARGRNDGEEETGLHAHLGGHGLCWGLAGCVWPVGAPVKYRSQKSARATVKKFTGLRPGKAQGVGPG